jgi:hypothetical protein
MTTDAKNSDWKRFRTASGLLVLMLLGVVRPAVAQPVVIFGPQKFVREEGKPATTGTAFSVPSEVTNCRLEINSDIAGPLSANNVSVKVNGVEMADSKTLRKGSPEQAEVELQATNTLLVTLKGKPGDSVTVKIIGDIAEIGEPEPPVRPLPPPD